MRGSWMMLGRCVGWRCASLSRHAERWCRAGQAGGAVRNEFFWFRLCGKSNSCGSVEEGPHMVRSQVSKIGRDFRLRQRSRQRERPLLFLGGPCPPGPSSSLLYAAPPRPWRAVPVEAMEGEAGFRARTSPPNGPASAPSLAASAASAGTLNGADHSYTASETLPRSQPLPSNGHAISCSIGHATRLLKREDTKDIREDVALNGRLYTFAAVFDGHGGAQAAEFCAQHMISYIEQAAQASPSPEGQIRDLISASQVCAARYK